MSSPAPAKSPVKAFLWNDLPWLAWNAILFGMIYNMSVSEAPPSPYRLILRLLLGTFIVKLLPNEHLSAWPYTGHLILIALIKFGAWLKPDPSPFVRGGACALALL